MESDPSWAGERLLPVSVAPRLWFNSTSLLQSTPTRQYYETVLSG